MRTPYEALEAACVQISDEVGHVCSSATSSEEAVRCSVPPLSLSLSLSSPCPPETSSEEAVRCGEDDVAALAAGAACSPAAPVVMITTMDSPGLG